jgi:flagellar hook-associated protein 1 FlgK
VAGILSIFNAGKLGLFAQQRALSVTSQNIANVNTPGYSRQEALFETTTPLESAAGGIGTGARIDGVRRVIDQFLDNQITSEQASLGRYQVDKNVLDRIEALFNDEQGTGINQAIDEFFAAWQDLASNPQGRPERLTLLSRAATLTQQIGWADAQLQQIQGNLNSEVTAAIADVNNVASQIAALNRQIGRAQLSGQAAGELLDERSRLLSGLAQQVDVSTFEDNLGQITVLIGGGRPLVEGDAAFAIRGVADPSNSGFVNIEFDPGTSSTVDITSSIANGRLKGLVDLRDAVVPGYIAQLDQVADAIITEVNAQHQLGFDLTGAAGVDFFTPTPVGSGAAGTMSVAISDPDLIAASATLAGVPGDNANALLLAQLQDKAVPALGSATIQGFYSGFVGEVGVRTQLAQRNLSAQDVVMRQLTQQRESVSGVSLDEEMTNLIRFQRAFEASARLITVADELYQSVLAMVR